MDDELEPQRRGDSFERVADLYDLYRPSPPRAVVDALIDLVAINERTRVVEFGSGTGQLSVPLAATGADLTCVEPGARLAAIAARNLSPFAAARVECASFEGWIPSTEEFDAVVVANAFHWLDPQLRVTKSSGLLRPGGRLAILHTHHVYGGTPGFLESSQHCYVRSGLAPDLSFTPPRPEQVPASYPELEHAPSFATVRRERFEIPTEYTTEEYVGLLQTDSLVNTLGSEPRTRFLDEIGRLIETSFGGHMQRAYLYELIVATRG